MASQHGPAPDPDNYLREAGLVPLGFFCGGPRMEYCRIIPGGKQSKDDEEVSSEIPSSPLEMLLSPN